MPKSYGLDYTLLEKQTQQFKDRNLIRIVNQNVQADSGKINGKHWLVDFENEMSDGDAYVVVINGSFHDAGRTEEMWFRQILETRYWYYNNLYKQSHSTNATFNAPYENKSESEGAIELTVLNQKNKIEYIKQSGKLTALDPSGEGEEENSDQVLVADNPLAGAKFQLKKQDGETWIDVGDVVESGDDGKFFWEGLAPGKYQVWETETPAGHREPDSFVSSFTVEQSGNIVLDAGYTNIIINERDAMVFYLDKIWEDDQNKENSIKIGTLELELAAPAGKFFPEDLTAETEIPEERKYKISGLIKDAEGNTTAITIEIPLKNAGEEVIVGTETKDAIKILVPGNWPEGDYTLTETKAPAGFRRTEKNYTINISKEDKTITYKPGDGTEDVLLYDGAEEAPIREVLKIINERGVFPSTGGTGPLYYSLFGMFIMALAIIIKRRKKVIG